MAARREWKPKDRPFPLPTDILLGTLVYKKIIIIIISILEISQCALVFTNFPEPESQGGLTASQPVKCQIRKISELSVFPSGKQQRTHPRPPYLGVPQRINEAACEPGILLHALPSLTNCSTVPSATGPPSSSNHVS